MTQDLYRRLQKQLDQYSVGFPETDSGIEIEILQSLFAEADAQLFVQLTPALETASDIAQRISQPPAQVSRQLESMVERGLLFRLKRAGAVKYGAIPFVHGIFEFQVKDLSRDLARKLQLYFDEAFDKNLQNNGDLFLRTVPINQSLDATQRVASYDDALEILREKDQIVVAPCICRVRTNLLDSGCDKPTEVCFMFGSMGQYYLDKGMGRVVAFDEAKQILERCHEAGLVTQPATAQNPAGMCNCCGDCCGPLSALNKHAKPAELVFSNYIARLDVDECTRCETCIERCQMNALQMTVDDVVALNLDRCIGCGLCVTTCPSQALSLEPKASDKQRTPPKNSMDQMMQLAIKRKVF